MDRYERLLSQMTFEEKAVLLTGDGNLLTRAIPRLDIPSIRMSDGPHGVSNMHARLDGGMVCYPTASAMGATWDRDLIEKTGAALAEDCKLLGIDMLLGPGVNMKRLPHCGRNFEYFSEDPVLTGELGAAYINGLQGQGIGASVKHFALNNQETDRNHINVEVDPRTLREYYLKAFSIICKKSQPASVMCAYNKMDGIWCSENPFLLRTLLREEMDYDGMIISDWGAVHHSARCTAAGLDLQMPEIPNIANRLQAGLDHGLITMEDIDNAVLRILRFIFRLKDMAKPAKPYNRDTQHQLAYTVAAESITLLKNQDSILPITKEKYKRIEVRGLGKFAENPRIMGGGSSFVFTDSASVDLPITYLRRYAEEENIELVYQPDTDPQAGFDACIIFIGNGREHGFEMEREAADRASIRFCSYVSREIRLACEVCDNVIVVMQVGSAAIPFQWDKTVKGLVQQWYSGEAGGKAIADILFGKVNPSGKLSETFPMEERQDLDFPGDGLKVRYAEGAMVGYRYYDAHPQSVWFPFGHGLSYTEFSYTDLHCETDDNTVSVQCRVKNIGGRFGKEIVQLYVQDVESTATKPQKELRDFAKIALAPSEETQVSFTLAPDAFAYYNPSLARWLIEAGHYKILIGASCADIRLSQDVLLPGDKVYTCGIAQSRLVMARDEDED